MAPLNTDLARTSVPSLTMTVPVMVLADEPPKAIVSGASSVREFEPLIAPAKTSGPLAARHTAPEPETATELLKVVVPAPLCVTSLRVSGSPPTL